MWVYCKEMSGNDNRLEMSGNSYCFLLGPMGLKHALLNDQIHDILTFMETCRPQNLNTYNFTYDPIFYS